MTDKLRTAFDDIIHGRQPREITKSIRASIMEYAKHNKDFMLQNKRKKKKRYNDQEDR